MSLDELREDLKRNIAEARTLTGADSAHLNGTMWPFIEALVDVIEEIDDAFAEHIAHEEDYLQPETAAIFAAVVQSSLQIAAELRKRAGADPVLAQLIGNHESICEHAVAVLGEITMVPSDDDDDEENDDDDEAQADAESGGPRG